MSSLKPIQVINIGSSIIPQSLPKSSPPPLLIPSVIDHETSLPSIPPLNSIPISPTSPISVFDYPPSPVFSPTCFPPVANPPSPLRQSSFLQPASRISTPVPASIPPMRISQQAGTIPLEQGSARPVPPKKSCCKRCFSSFLNIFCSD